MKCRKAKKFIYDLLDNVLSDSESLRLESHLRECPSCEDFRRHLQKSLDLVHNLPSYEPSENFNWKVRLQLARERHSLTEEFSSHAGFIKRWNLRFALGTVAAFAVVLAGGILFLDSFTPASLETPAGISASPTVVTAPSRTVAPGGRGMAGYWQEPYSPQRIGERLVAQGATMPRPGPQSFQAIDEEAAAIALGPDSLVASKLRDLKRRYQVHYLERQIELLQDYLRQCQSECK